MNISVEISMYPLTDQFIPVIDQFLKKLHHIDDLKVRTNAMSTQVIGESTLVFQSLNQLITETYRNVNQCPFVLKVLNTDVSERPIPSY